MIPCVGANDTMCWCKRYHTLPLHTILCHYASELSSQSKSMVKAFISPLESHFEAPKGGPAPPLPPSLYLHPTFPSHIPASSTPFHHIPHAPKCEAMRVLVRGAELHRQREGVYTKICIILHIYTHTLKQTYV